MGFPYGAVGPLCRQGNTKILTHDFTHRTHMEVFEGEYYPPQLTDWWMDDWIARAYGSTRTRQAKSIEVGLPRRPPTRVPCAADMCGWLVGPCQLPSLCL